MSSDNAQAPIASGNDAVAVCRYRRLSQQNAAAENGFDCFIIVRRRHRHRTASSRSASTLYHQKLDEISPLLIVDYYIDGIIT